MCDTSITVFHWQVDLGEEVLSFFDLFETTNSSFAHRVLCATILVSHIVSNLKMSTWYLWQPPIHNPTSGGGSQSGGLGSFSPQNYAFSWDFGAPGGVRDNLNLTHSPLGLWLFGMLPEATKDQKQRATVNGLCVRLRLSRTPPCAWKVSFFAGFIHSAITQDGEDCPRRARQRLLPIPGL